MSPGDRLRVLVARLRAAPLVARVVVAVGLLRVVVGGPRQARLAETLDALVGAYVDDYGVPLIEIAKENPAAARSPVATTEGLIRIGSVRTTLSRLLAAEDRLVSRRASSARSSAN